jgi:hypothetical protein
MKAQMLEHQTHFLGMTLELFFYLNDDYEGGELYFPLQGIEFKPNQGPHIFFQEIKTIFMALGQ